MKRVKRLESRVKSQKWFALALLIAGAAMGGADARGQCYVDPVTGQQVCPLIRQPAISQQLPALDPKLSPLNSSAHCRVTVGDGTAGSGTLVARSQRAGLVLTCSHLVDSSTSRIVVLFPSGERLDGYIAERDRANDLTALVIRRPNVEPVEVSDADAAGVVTACGFGPNGQFRSIRGAIVGRATATGATNASLLMSGAVRPGDSGGGVLDAAGRLVGVVWGQRDGLTYATCGRPVREILERVLGRGQGAGSREGGAWSREHGAGSEEAGGESRGLVGNDVAPRRGPDVDWPTWANEIEARIKALDAAKQDKGDFVQRGELPDTSQFARRDELDGGLQVLRGRFESVLRNVETVRERVAEASPGPGGFFGGMSIGKLLVGALGLSGPLAAAVVIASGLAGRRAKKLLASQATRLNEGSVTAIFPKSAPIAVDSPPPPQQAVPETHYVSYETDSFAKAHQWASEQVARKYPGATDLLHAQESLIKQHLAGRKG